MTAEELKLELHRELLWAKHYLCVVNEAIHNSDVFGIKPSLFCVEYEVKVNKYDLLNELDCINGGCKGGWNKSHKHNWYLGKNDAKVYGDKYFIPNEFYLAVPSELVDTALNGIKDTPYGVVAIGDYYGGYENRHKFYGYWQPKKAKRLHDRKLEPDYAWGIIRKVMTENFELREKVVSLKYKSNPTHTPDELGGKDE